MPTIRTTMRPGDEIVVTDAEYEQLLDLGLIYDGTPPVEPADAFDTRVAQRLADSDSATRTAFDTIYTDVVDGDIAPILSNPESAASVALRAASVAAVEEADEVSPAGQWDFAIAPTIDGSPIGTGGGPGITPGTTAGQIPVWDGNSYEPQTPTEPTAADLGLSAVATSGAYGDLTGRPNVEGAIVAAGVTGNLRGAWAGSTVYAVGDVVTAEAGAFRAVGAHTSHATGFRYDRERWVQVPLPALAGPSTVPVRQLDLSAVGVGITNPPVAGLFQRRPKQFNYSQERVLLTFAAPGDITTSGSGASTAAGTTAGGTIVGTVTGSGTWTGVKTFTAKDLTGLHLRIPIKASAAGNRYMVVNLTSSGTDYTNSVQTQLLAAETPTGGWQTYSVPLTDMTTAGTGVNFAAVNGIKIEFTGPGTIEFGRVLTHPNAAKGKCILWFDDGFSNHLAAVKTAAGYGFPVTLASIAQNLLDTSSIGADNARYIQDVLHGQIAVHAFGANDHNSTLMNDAQLLEEMLAYQHFGLALGFHGVEDMAYFNPGLNGPSTPERQAIAKRLFRSARGTGARYVETLPPGDATFTRALQQGAGNTSASTFQPFAQKAINCKGLAQFVWHSMDATALTEFATFCAWLDANRASIDVVTPAQAFDPLCV